MQEVKKKEDNINRQTVHRFGVYPLISDEQTTSLPKSRNLSAYNTVRIFMA